MTPLQVEALGFDKVKTGLVGFLFKRGV